MKRFATLGMLAPLACLLTTIAFAQNSTRGLSPADSRPSLVAPPTGSVAPQASPSDFRPIESYPPCNARYVDPAVQPTTSLSPIVLPPASRTYVPPPPNYRYEGQPVTFSRPIVYQRPVAPVVVAPAPRYYAPPLLPVTGVPPGATIGQGILGQPTVYVPGQPVRNVLRYLSP